MQVGSRGVELVRLEPYGPRSRNKVLALGQMASTV